MKTTKSLKRTMVTLGAITLLVGVSDLTLGKGGFWSPLTPGNIEGRWRMNEGSGTTISDISGNSNTGTLTGGVTWVDGKEGKGLSFDGTDDYVDCGTTGLPANNASQSITWWHKVSSVPSTTQCIIDVHNNVSNSSIQAGYKNQKLTVWKHGGDVLVEATSPSDGGWHHYAYTFDGTTHRLFIDGLEWNSSTVAPQTATPDTLVFGRWDGGPSQYFAGELDEVRIYSRTLTVAEVKGLAGNPGLEALLRLDEGTGTTTADVSGNDNDGTLNNGPTWVAGKGGNALDFDGSDDYVASSATGFPAADEPQTIAYWQNVSSTPSTVQCAVDIHNNTSNHSVQGGFRSSKVTFWQHGGTVLVDATAPSTGAWHHIAYTFDGTTHRLYIDGTEQSTSTVTPQTAAPDTFVLGRYDKGTSEYFSGKLDDVRVYSRELSADEVKGLAGGSGTGLAAVYYDNIDWTGSFVTRTDSVVLFDWGTGSPDPAIGADTFSAVWTGQVEAQFDEIYRFYTLTDDGVRLWVDGKLVIDFPNDMAATLKQGIPIALEAGKKYDVRMEYYENLVFAVAALGWESPSQPLTFIPQSQLYPTDSTVPTFDTATAESSDLKTVYLRFSERMDKTTAETAGNYTVSGGITVNSATLSSDGRLVTLAVASDVTLGTTTVQASSSILGITREAIATTTKTIVAGSPEGIPDSTAVTLELSTDDNERVIHADEAQKITLTVTAPGTTATTVDLSQFKKFQNGLGWVKFDAIGDNLDFSVTTSGGTPNQATVKLRGQDEALFKDDAQLVARVSGEERGFKDFTVASFTISPQCVYSADQRPVKQTVQLTPAIEGVQILTTSRLTLGGGLAGADAGTLLSADQFSETDSSGAGTRQYVSSELDTYIINAERFLTSSTEDNEESCMGSDWSDDGPKYKPCDEPTCPPGHVDQSGSQSCQAASATDTGKSTRKPVASGGGSSNSIDVSNGEKKLDIVDLAIRGRGLHYEFRRVYLSHNYRKAILNPGDFGENWTFSYADDFLVKDGSDSTAPIIHFQEGQSNSTYVFRGTVNGWEPVRELFTQLRKNTNPQPDVFELRNRDGGVRTYHDFSSTATPNKNGRLKEIRDRNGNFMSFLYDQIDPDGTASNGDEKFVLTRVVDSLGREIRYEYYAATAQSSGGRTLTILETGTGARGRLARVRDFKGDMDFSDADASEDFPNQVNNRTLHFDYDTEGNLVRCSGPAVGGTPTANDFPNGKTTRYKYIVEGDLSTLVTNWGTLTNDQKDVVRGRLLHAMTHLWWPNEVKNTPGSNPPDGDAAEILTYDTTATFDPPSSTFLAANNFLGFVKSYAIGGQNGNGVPSGGTISYTYTDLNSTRSMPGSVSADYTLLLNVQTVKVEVTDRNGNEAEYIWGGARNLLEYREKTSGLRTGEPANYLLTLEHQKDELLKKQTLPEGNLTQFTFNEGSTDRFQQGNLIRIVRTPDAARGGDQAKIETVMVYEPIYNRPCLVVQARGSDTDNNGFTPPVADVLDRTMTDPYDASKKLDLRYATVEFFDYQESTEKASAAPASRKDKDGSGGQVNQSPLITFDADVLTTEVWLVQELGLAETTTGEGLDELRTRLSDNLTNLGLGDLNGDNDTIPTIAGNIIRTVFGSPVILANTNQHALESAIDGGDLIDTAKTYAQGGANEGAQGGRLQTIVWMTQYNDFGQVVQTISPEGNVTTHEYFAENDPDGDAVTTPTPADGRTLVTQDSTTNRTAGGGGYVHLTVIDRTRTDSYVKFFDQGGTNKATATFHNNNTAPTAVDINQCSCIYDDVGNRIERHDPRGIRYDMFVNELDEVIQVTSASDVSEASNADPADPLVGASIGPLTAFAYKTRTFFDFNGNLVLSQIEDRGNTSSVDGSGLGTLPSQATDTTPGLSSADGAGGDAFVDSLSLFDRLNNLIETRSEVDSSTSLNTKHRHDGNQHRVLTIYPEGNADSQVFDDRELLFQMVRGTTTRPAAGKYAAGDPTTFDRPGGAGTVASTVTYNYDDNQNLIEMVDAEDTDASAVNNSTVAGAGDVTAYTYDGYDRRKTVRDPDGNTSTIVYDPDSNAVRVFRDGDPVDDVVPGSFPDTDNRTLAVTETIHDSLSRATVIHQVLFQTPVATPTRTPSLTDTSSMDTLSAYLSDANSDTAAVPGATGISVIGRVSSIQEFDRESRGTFAIQDDLDLHRTDYDGASRTIRTMDSHVATGFSGGLFTPTNQKGNVFLQAYDDNSNVIEIREFDVIDIDANGVADSFDANHDGAVNASDTVLDFDLDGTADAAAEVFRSTMLYDSLDRSQTSVDNVTQTLDQRYDSRSNRVSGADAQGPVTTRTIARRWKNPFDPTDADISSVTVNHFGNVTRSRFDGPSRLLESEVVLTASGQGDGVKIGATLEGVQAKSGGDVDYTDVPTRDSNQSADGLISVTYAYDDNSQLLALRDDNGNTTATIYDNQNRTLVERKGLGETGTSFTITGGDSGAFVVALRGGTAPVDTEAAGTDITYSYDKDSNVIQVIDEAGNDLDYTYDALNRRKTLAITQASGFIGTTSQTWKFDGLSRQGECTDNNDTGTGDDVTCRYLYDSLSRKVEEGQQVGAAATFKDLSCSFDIQTSGAVWAPSQCTYPDGRKVDSTYDTLDRLVSRQDNGQSSAIGTYAYIGKWREATLTFQNDTRLSYLGQTTPNAQEGYDDLRRDTRHRWESFTAPDTTPGNDALLVGFGHEFGTVGVDGRATPAYDRMSNKLIEEKLHDSDSSEVYVYDSAYRIALPTSTYRSPAPANAYQRGTLNSNRDNIATLTARPGQRQKEDWTLDGPGNWATNPFTEQGVTAVTETRNHTDFNEINQRTISTDNTTQTLDKNGNITDTGQDVGTGGSRFFGGGLRMEWDALNRLRKVYYNANTPGSTGDDTLIAEYTYDCGNRRMRRVFTNNTTSLNGTTEYYYESWRVYEERDGSNAVLQQYTYGNYLDDAWTLDDRRSGITVAQLNDGSGSQRRFYHCNTLFSIFALTDETGAIVEGYQYNAYGTPTVWSGAGTDAIWFTNDDVVSTTTNGAPLSAVGNPYLYTSQRLEAFDLPETALHYYKNRYYGYEIGRFLSRDPHWQFTGLNLYEYIAGNPLNGIDTLGLIYKQKPTKYVKQMRKGLLGRPLGNTDADFEVEGDCRECNACKGKWEPYLVKFLVTTQINVGTHWEWTNPSSGNTWIFKISKPQLDKVVEHEEVHADAFRRWHDNNVNAAEARFNKQGCIFMTEADCQDYVKKREDEFKDLWDIMYDDENLHKGAHWKTRPHTAPAPTPTPAQEKKMH